MNIDDLTLGQIKQIQNLLNSNEQQSESACFADVVGRYVLVRTRLEGVNAGYLVSAGPGFVELKGTRRLWYHEPAEKSTSWYEGVSLHGLSDNSKLSPAVEKKIIVEDYSITVCTEKAQKSIEAIHSYEQQI